MIDQPERVIAGGREPLGRKLLGAMLATATTALVRQAARRIATRPPRT
jgi:hypothetical protein